MSQPQPHSAAGSASGSDAELQYPTPSDSLLAENSLVDRSSIYHKPAYTPIDSKLQLILESAYLHAGESFIESKCLTGGLSNSNYLWKTSMNSYLCKICNEKSIIQLNSHMKILKLLKHSMNTQISKNLQIPIAFPVSIRNPHKLLNRTSESNEFIIEYQPINENEPNSSSPPMAVIFYEYLSGSNPTTPNSSIIRQMSRGQAMIHRITKNSNINTNNSTNSAANNINTNGISEYELLLGHNQFPLGEIERFMNDINNNKIPTELFNNKQNNNNQEYIEFIKSEYKIIKPFLNNLNNSLLYPYALNHGDLFLENVMFNTKNKGNSSNYMNNYNSTDNDNLEYELSGFIDFEEMFFGPRLLDIAVTFVGCLFNDANEFSISLAAEYLHEYNQYEPLNELEWNSLYPAIRYCLLGISQWFFELFHIRQPDFHPARQVAHIPLLKQIMNLPRNLNQILRELVMKYDPVAEHKAIHGNNTNSSTSLSGPASIPSPLSMAELRSIRDSHMGFNTVYSYTKSRFGPIHVSRGYQQFIFDTQGNRYLDAYNNVTHVGHSHKAIQQAADHQLSVINTNTRYGYDILPHYILELLKTLPPELGLNNSTAAADGNSSDDGGVIFFCNSGSEANDLALRMASELAGRSREFIVMDHAYHGVSTQVLEVSPYLFNGPGGFGQANNIHIAEIPDTYRGKYRIDDDINQTEEKCGELYANSVIQHLEKIKSSGKRVAAFLHESVIGCGGQIPYPKGYLKLCYEKVKAAGGFCIADEVQTGFGRCGENYWAFQNYDDGKIIPDFITLGKPMGNGFPLAGVICRRSLAEKLRNSVEWFSSCGGSPLSCRIGYTVCQIIKQENLQYRALNTGKYIINKLKELQFNNEIPEIGDIRGSGLFIGIEFINPELMKSNGNNSNIPIADSLCSSFVVNYLRDNPQSATMEEMKIELESGSMGSIENSTIPNEDYRVSGILCGTDGYSGNVIKIKPPMLFNTFDSYLLIKGIQLALNEWRKIKKSKEKTN